MFRLTLLVLLTVSSLVLADLPRHLDLVACPAINPRSDINIDDLNGDYLGVAMLQSHNRGRLTDIGPLAMKQMQLCMKVQIEGNERNFTLKLFNFPGPNNTDHFRVTTEDKGHWKENLEGNPDNDVQVLDVTPNKSLTLIQCRTVAEAEGKYVSFVYLISRYNKLTGELALTHHEIRSITNKARTESGLDGYRGFYLSNNCYSFK